MADVIKLLPDSVANQIAAGEVIQRPASAVKELMENAIDADASQIKLIVKDAGKTLIQVVDNGKGMSETDARLCFERHATSKISLASDLFSIRTMGFRGEALASIAAIARVELKTKLPGDQMGTEIIIEGSVTESQRPCQCQTGTSISVRNLFFNTPARRNFLKSEQVERGHILNEFIRIALSQPGIAFQYYQNNQLTFQLEKANLRQRIVALFGNQYLQRLIPVEEKTDILAVRGFVLKPEFIRKKKGDQYLYVNNRFIRSAFLNHALEQAFAELIPQDYRPSFFLFIDTEPDQIDVNVHPTKTEIKFQDEKYVYQIIKTAVRRSLGKFNIAPTLDFERETAFDELVIDKNKPVKPPVITINTDYNPFAIRPGGGKQPGSLINRANVEKWEQLFPGNDDNPVSASAKPRQTIISPDWTEQEAPGSSKKYLNLQNRYILAPVKSGLMVIDQRRAHERILYERFLHMLNMQKAPSQQLLFPEHIILAKQDADALQEMLSPLKAIGFEISQLNKSTFVINAVPADVVDKGPLQEIMEEIIEQFKINMMELKDDSKTNIARSLAKRMSLKQVKTPGDEEMIAMIDALFACRLPYQSPAGKPIVSILPMDEISEKFK